MCPATFSFCWRGVEIQADSGFGAACVYAGLVVCRLIRMCIGAKGYAGWGLTSRVGICVGVCFGVGVSARNCACVGIGVAISVIVGVDVCGATDLFVGGGVTVIWVPSLLSASMMGLGVGVGLRLAWRRYLRCWRSHVGACVLVHKFRSAGLCFESWALGWKLGSTFNEHVLPCCAVIECSFNVRCGQNSKSSPTVF